LQANNIQLAARRVDWAKCRTNFRGMQDNPILARILTTLEAQENSGVTSDWRSRIDAANPDEKEAVIAQAVREAVGSVLRVKADTLRDDQPLTDLGLDSLMGVEIENALEAAVGVALPPASLMRARTISQIAALIAGHLGGSVVSTAPAEPAPAPAPAAPTEVDVDALSDEEIDQLIGDAGPAAANENVVS
jgi:acyl carrier protein